MSLSCRIAINGEFWGYSDSWGQSRSAGASELSELPEPEKSEQLTSIANKPARVVQGGLGLSKIEFYAGGDGLRRLELCRNRRIKPRRNRRNWNRIFRNYRSRRPERPERRSFRNKRRRRPEQPERRNNRNTRNWRIRSRWSRSEQCRR